MNDQSAALSALFERAADAMSVPGPAPTENDVAALLNALGYDAPAQGPDNRAAMLRAAASFKRIFELHAPDAPGLVFFAGEVEPAIIAAGHARAAAVGVGGTGLSPREAFEGCIGEGIEYLSQLESGSEPLVSGSAQDLLAAAGDEVRRFLGGILPPDPAAPVECIAATGLGDAVIGLFPADICLRRLPDRAKIVPPFLLGTGCAAGRTIEDAVLHALCELVERDAAALWWRGGLRGRPVALESAAMAQSVALLAALRMEANTRRTWLLDITTDLEIPVVAAISCRPDGKGFACGLGARPTLASAACRAVTELCQSELAHVVVAAKRAERGAEGLNDRDRGHIARATSIDAHACELLHPTGVPARHDTQAPSEAGAMVEVIASRLAAAGIAAFRIDLTRPAFGIPVVRVIAPGLQIEPSQLTSRRLANAIALTGGGEAHTGGVSLLL
jgi:ribosomal protein S12 methylthiotransferase accessory factor